LEDEVPGTFRVVESQVKASRNYLFVYMGASGTTLFAVHKGVLSNVYYYPLGGLSVTKYVADSFGLPLNQAEMYKRTYGMDSGQLDGKVAKILEGVMSNLTSEIRKMIVNYKNEFSADVDAIYVSGGAVFMPEMLNFLSKSLDGVGGVELFDPLKGHKYDAKYNNMGTVFTQAIGLIT
jgi:Tfp pilus assembly PilM family ATPase